MSVFTNDKIVLNGNTANFKRVNDPVSPRIYNDEKILNGNIVDRSEDGVSKVTDPVSSDILPQLEKDLSEHLDPKIVKDLEENIIEFKELTKQNLINPEEVESIISLISQAKTKITNALEKASKSSKYLASSKNSLAMAGVLMADDLTVIGIGDDEMIPFLLLAAGGLAVAYLISKPSEKETQLMFDDAAKSVALVSQALKNTIENAKQQAKKNEKSSPKPLPPVMSDSDDDDSCNMRWIANAGNYPYHDEYARYIGEKYGNPTYATLDYIIIVRKPGGLSFSVKFDHYDPDTNTFYEVKTKHESLLAEWSSKHTFILEGLFDQAQRQADALLHCAKQPYKHIWIFDDKDVQIAANDYLGGIVDEVLWIPWKKR